MCRTFSNMKNRKLVQYNKLLFLFLSHKSYTLVFLAVVSDIAPSFVLTTMLRGVEISGDVFRKASPK